jgi:hypothetical protein
MPDGTGQAATAAAQQAAAPADYAVGADLTGVAVAATAAAGWADHGSWLGVLLHQIVLLLELMKQLWQHVLQLLLLLHFVRKHNKSLKHDDELCR